MKELNIMEATVLTSPNPLTLICSEKEDGSTNLALICFVSYKIFPLSYTHYQAYCLYLLEQSF